MFANRLIYLAVVSLFVESGCAGPGSLPARDNICGFATGGSTVDGVPVLLQGTIKGDGELRIIADHKCPESTALLELSSKAIEAGHASVLREAFASSKRSIVDVTVIAVVKGRYYWNTAQHPGISRLIADEVSDVRVISE